MWKEGSFGERIEEVVVGDGFIVEQGDVYLGYCDSGRNGNPFLSGLVHLPAFSIQRVHSDHPMRVLAPDRNYLHVEPTLEEDILDESGRRKLPMGIWKDPVLHDLALFVHVPFGLEGLNGEGRRIEIYEQTFSSDSFSDKGGTTSIDFILRFPGFMDYPHFWGQVSEGQVLNHFYSWSHRIKPVYVRGDRSSEIQRVGFMNLDYDNARDLLGKFSPVLEERFGVPLSYRSS